MTKRSVADIRDVARRSFGHRKLLPGQEDAMRAVVGGHDVLLVAPTGAGKSLTFQVSGMLLGGCTIVVSPLLALAADQIRSLGETDAAPTGARLSSQESQGQRDAALRDAESGAVEFLFVAPEQLANGEVLERLAALRPGLVAVDEAHCVSTWGHDFRPDYGRLGDLIDQLGRPRVLAMTATASAPVRADIVQRLRMHRPVEVVTGFARDNISLAVDLVADQAAQRQAVLDAVVSENGPGIVYCRTRRSTDEYAAALEDLGVSVTSYHAGMGRRRRQAAHDAFLEGEADVMVATSAFGMGIDKADIRYVVHAQVPDSIDTYYQEVGRAGRDAAPATARLFYRPEDLALARYFSSGVPARDDVVAVARTIAEVPTDDVGALQERTSLGPRRLKRIVNLVEQVVESGAAGVDDTDGVVEGVIERAEAHRTLERSRVEMMRAYAETDRCRLDFVLGYFGDAGDGPCGHCDNCRESDGAAAVTSADRMTADGLGRDSQVVHADFGRGVVTDVEDDRLTVLFDEAGYRQLSRDVVESADLLRPEPADARGQPSAK